jgi:hypothetical protein
MLSQNCRFPLIRSKSLQVSARPLVLRPDLLYSGPFAAGPFEGGPFVSGPFQDGPFEAGHFVGVPLQRSVKSFLRHSENKTKHVYLHISAHFSAQILQDGKTIYWRTSTICLFNKSRFTGCGCFTNTCLLSEILKNKYM